MAYCLFICFLLLSFLEPEKNSDDVMHLNVLDSPARAKDATICFCQSSTFVQNTAPYILRAALERKGKQQ